MGIEAGDTRRADPAAAPQRSAESGQPADASDAQTTAGQAATSVTSRDGSASREGPTSSEGSASDGSASASRGLPPVASAAAGVKGGSGEALTGIVGMFEALAGTVLSAAVSDLELVASVGVIRRLQAMLAAERYRRVAEVDERCAYRVVGAGSTETWLAESQRVARPDAVVEVTVARALQELPATAGMLARGEIDEASARVAGMAWRDVAREASVASASGAGTGSGSDDGEGGFAAGAPDPPADPAAGGAGGGAAGGAAGGAGGGAADHRDAPEGSSAGNPADAGKHGNGDTGAGEGKVGASTGATGAGGWDDDELAARIAAHERAREQARRDFDEMMAAQAQHKDRQGVSRGVRRWRDRQDPERGASRARRAHKRRDLWISNRRDSDGTTTVSGRLDDVGAAKLRAAIDALSRPAEDAGRRQEDKRTAGQRRADALVSLAERSLDAGDLPRVTRQRPHVLLVTSAEGLHGVDGAPAPHLDGVGEIDSATARMLCCDASVAPVTIRNGEVLDAGPRQTVVSARQRDAVLARDRQCVGCGTRAALCQIHHIVWLSRGGTHDLDNLVLVCFDCHFHIHHHDWQVARHADGRYWLARPATLTQCPSRDQHEDPDRGAHRSPQPDRPDNAPNRSATPAAEEGSAGACPTGDRGSHDRRARAWDPSEDPSPISPRDRPSDATHPPSRDREPAPAPPRVHSSGGAVRSPEGQGGPRGHPKDHPGVRGSPGGPGGRGSLKGPGKRRRREDLAEPRLFAE